MGDQIESIAEVCHEANRAYCRTLGDRSQPAWEGAPEWQKESGRKGVRGILAGTIKSPRESHASWALRKTAEGWKYGEMKDPAKKLHPCMVPFDELPEEQQRKDHLFFGIVQALRE